MHVHATSWAELRTRVKCCLFEDCPRNKPEKKERLPIFFERKENSLTRIRFVAVSQDPSVNLRCLTNSECIERFLIQEALKERELSGAAHADNPIDRIKEIFQCKRFDPSTGDIYWTHALKCLPTECNDEINGIWKKSAPLCVEHFKNELDLIPSKKLTVIAFGGYALAMCLHVLDCQPLVDSQRIMKYITTPGIEKPFKYDHKEVTLFPFLHPSYRTVHANDRIKMREQQFADEIQEMRSGNHPPE